MSANVCIARSAFADFEAGQWTFEPESGFRVGAGTYVIMLEPQYAEMEAQRCDLIAELKRCRSVLVTTLGETPESEEPKRTVIERRLNAANAVIERAEYREVAA